MTVHAHARAHSIGASELPTRWHSPRSNLGSRPNAGSLESQTAGDPVDTFGTVVGRDLDKMP